MSDNQADRAEEDTVKVSATLRKETFHRLNSMAARKGVSMTRILERTINREHYLYQVEENGGKVLTEDKNRRFKIVSVDDD